MLYSHKLHFGNRTFHESDLEIGFFNEKNTRGHFAQQWGPNG